MSESGRNPQQIRELDARFRAPVLAVANALGGAITPAYLSAFYQICGSRRQALATAILNMALSLIGIGIGPLVTGALSDALTPSFGALSLRYAMMFTTLVLIPTGVTMWCAARTFAQDAEE